MHSRRRDEWRGEESQPRALTTNDNDDEDDEPYHAIPCHLRPFDSLPECISAPTPCACPQSAQQETLGYQKHTWMWMWMWMWMWALGYGQMDIHTYVCMDTWHTQGRSVHGAGAKPDRAEHDPRTPTMRPTCNPHSLSPQTFFNLSPPLFFSSASASASVLTSASTSAMDSKHRISRQAADLAQLADLAY
jgi:hypothetical protein